MLHSVWASSLILAALVTLTRAGEYDDKAVATTATVASVTDFNCPSLADNAIIRLKPCYKNTNYLAACTDDWCAPGSNDVIIRELTGDNLKYAEWRVRAPATLPAGHVILSNVGKPGDLSVDEVGGYYPNNFQGRDGMLMASPKDPKMTQWRWDLRPEKWPCRVLLRNNLISKKLGLIRNDGAKNKDNMKTFAVFADGSSLTDETWEVEYVRMAPPDATGVAGVASAGDAKAADPPAVTVTVTTTQLTTTTSLATTMMVVTSACTQTVMQTTTTVAMVTATASAAAMPPSGGYDMGPPPAAPTTTSTTTTTTSSSSSSSTASSTTSVAAVAAVSTTTVQSTTTTTNATAATTTTATSPTGQVASTGASGGRATGGSKQGRGSQKGKSTGSGKGGKYGSSKKGKSGGGSKKGK